jgi:L-fucose isomerase-like protein
LVRRDGSGTMRGQICMRGRGVVTSCWCYGSETMDMDPLLPKAVWSFNGTERPGVVLVTDSLL